MTPGRQHALGLVGALALLSPLGSGVAAAQAKPRKRVLVQTRTFTGRVVDASDWGQVEIRLEERRTVTIVGTRRTVAHHMYGLGVPVWPSHANRSIEINDQALPILVHEALVAQSAQIDQVSGATYTSEAFTQSLQAALLQANAW